MSDGETRPNAPPDGRRPAASREWLVLLAISASGFALRLACWLQIRGSPLYSIPLADSRAYDRLAREIAAGDVVGAHVFYQDPLYPYVLALLYRLFGPSPAAVIVVQSILGAASAFLLGVLTHRLFGRAAGLVAAALVALYRPFLFGEMLLDKNALTIVLTAALLCVLTGAIADGRGRWRASLGAGLILGLLSLLRGNFLLVAPIVAAAIAWQSSGQRLVRAGAVLAGTLIPILPVTIRNAYVGHDFVLTTAQAGQNFYIGNNPENRFGGYEPPSFVRANPDYEEPDFRSAAESEVGRAMKPSEVSAFWLRKGLAWIADHPLDFLRVTGHKALRLVNGAEAPDVYCVHLFEEQAPILRWPLLGFWALFPLAACGLFYRRLGSREQRLVAIVAAGYALSLLPFFVFDRYRLPIVVPLVPFAAMGVIGLAQSFRKRAWPSFFAGLGVAAAALSVTQIPVAPHSAAGDHLNLGTAYLLRGERARAIEELGASVAIEPDVAVARHNLGEALLSEGRAGEALVQFETEARLLPAAAEPLYAIGRAERALGKLEGAASRFRAALERNASLHAARFDLARTLEALGQRTEAREAYAEFLKTATDSKKRDEAQAALERLSP